MKKDIPDYHPNISELSFYSSRSLNLNKTEIEKIGSHLMTCKQCQVLCPDSNSVLREDIIISIFGYVPSTEIFPGRLEEAKRTKKIWMRDNPDDAFCSDCNTLYAEECECAYKAALKVMQTNDATYLIEEGYEMDEIDKLLKGEITPESLLKEKEVYPNSEVT